MPRKNETPPNETPPPVAIVPPPPPGKRATRKVNINGFMYTPVDATTPLRVLVTSAHIKNAVRGDPCQCVMGLAIKEGCISGSIEQVFVGSNIVKVVMSDRRIVRYSTPVELRLAIPVYDKTGEWGLPPGDIILKPPVRSASLFGAGRPSRWHKHQNAKPKTGQTQYQGRAAKTRIIPMVNVLTHSTAARRGTDGTCPVPR